MKKGSKRLAAVLTLISMTPSAFAEAWVPALELKLAFGSKAVPVSSSLGLAVSGFVTFDSVRSERIHLPLAGLSLSTDSPVQGLLLGVPLQARAQSNAAANEESNGSNTWLWWGLGAAAAVGAVVLLSGQGGDDDNATTPQDGGCNTVGGTTLVPPSDDVMVNPNCRPG